MDITTSTAATATNRRRWWTLGVLCLSLLVVSLDNTILNVALPTLVEDLGATASQQQWMVDAYTLIFASLLLATGSLGDKFGRRGALVTGMVIFGAGSGLAAFASSAWMLIGLRALMGVGGALIMPATLSILTNVFTDAKERTKAIAIWAGVSGLGVAVGPVLGGWMLEHFWWGSVFLINVPVILFSLAVIPMLVPTSRDPESPRLDPLGTSLSLFGLVAVLYAIIEAPSHGWTNPGILGAFGVGTVLLGTFVWWELHTDHPVLDVRLFKNMRFTGASVAISLVMFALFGSIFFLTQFLQFVLGYGTLKAGLSIAPVAASIMVASLLSPRLTARFGTKFAVGGGLGIVAAALLLLSTIDTGSGYGLVFTTIMILGFGMGMAMTPATDSIMGAVPASKAGVGSAMNDTTREVGGALGVAILGSLLAGSYHSAMSSSAVVGSLPAEAQAVAHDSLGGAVHVAQQLGENGTALLHEASSAFVDGMGTAVLVGAAVAALGALIALIWLPNRAPTETELAEIDAEWHGEVDDLPALVGAQ
ncbi:MAG: MFS transporter [Ilumatobacteraceae bacterium]